jgi:hypothetical protein
MVANVFGISFSKKTVWNLNCLWRIQAIWGIWKADLSPVFRSVYVVHLVSGFNVAAILSSSVLLKQLEGA